MQALIAAHPFGLLISTGPEGLLANGLPFRRTDTRLQAHIARANPQWQSLDGQQVLVVFQGPLSYVSPGFYASKAEHGKVVPTWNYAMVQVRGMARLRDDPACLAAQIASLTDGMEAARPEPWAVSDAPDDFIAMQMKAIVGIEIEVTALEGKWKVSQNRNEADKRGVAEGLAESHPDMAALVRGFGNL
jgi:transcriptional regulator